MLSKNTQKQMYNEMKELSKFVVNDSFLPDSSSQRSEGLDDYAGD